jgi:hypothetical protein
LVDEVHDIQPTDGDSMFLLTWSNPSLPYLQKQVSINVPPGAVVSNQASLIFTGKGAPNYGKVQQENLMRLLENFASNVEPANATVGQIWYDTSSGVMKVCTSSPPVTTARTWKAVGGMQVTEVGAAPPSPATLGDTWFSKTGSASGTLYVYTGVGRYPQIQWDSTGYYPPANTTTLAVKLNTSTFAGAVGSNMSEAYISGYTGASPADVNGSIIDSRTGTAITIPRGALWTNFPNDGFLVWDESGGALMTSTGDAASRFFSVRRLADDRWQYDNNIAWVDFTPGTTPGERTLAIGRIVSTTMEATGGAGISSITLWTTALPVNDLLLVPSTLVEGAIGGWEQVYPPIDLGAGRREYDYINGLLMRLIGDQFGFGGSGAFGRYIDFLTPFDTLDASLRRAYRAAIPEDMNVLIQLSDDSLGTLDVDPNSQDWDKLLSACRWAIARYELPEIMLDRISPLPFIQDGLPPAPITRVSTTSPLAARLQRHSRTRWGSISLLQFYQETVNVLGAAIASRYKLRGILGTSGTNDDFAPGVGITNHQLFSIDATTNSLATLRENGLRFRFSAAERQRFFTSGQAIEIFLTHAPTGSGASDTDLVALCSARGRWRLTFDALYNLSTAASPTLVSVIDGGYSTMSTTKTDMQTVTSGAATVSIQGNIGANGSSPDSIDLFVRVSTTGATTGVFSVSWRWIDDSTTYGAGLRLYPAPLAFTSTDELGSSATQFVIGTVTPPPVSAPVASFTVTPSPATGNPAAITLVDTSTNSPTLIEWDYTNDGSFDAVGVGGDTRVQNYTPGTYTIRMRATNAAGSNITTRSLTVNSPAVLGAPFRLAGGTTVTVAPQPDIAAHVDPIAVTSTTTPTATVTINGTPIAGMTWTGTAPNFNLSQLPTTAVTLSQNGGTMVVQATSPVGTTTGTFTLNVQPRTVPAQFRWYANSGSLTSGAGTTTATVAQGAATVYLASSITGNMSNPRATAISVVSGSLPPGMSLVSLADWNSGASSTVAFTSNRVKITNNSTVNTVGTYNFTLRVNWDNNSVATPDFTDYTLTLTVT